ncbi:MAG: helix-turn-helix transcriptional regulator [Mucispirillum sp.]|nr:helix-turn-helix transcriptional regulator [Mucispirillum sp.]
MDNNTPKYMISIASEILRLHPQTLRQYERLGLVMPCRVDGKNRLYSENDIEKLQFIKTLTQQQGVNLAGVEIILNMQDQITLLNKKILQIETNIQSKYGEDISVMDRKTNNIKTIKIEREK